MALLSLASPVLDCQARDGAQVAITANDNAVAQASRNGRDHHVDLLDDAATPLYFGEDTSILICWFVEQPADRFSQPAAGDFP